MHKKDIKQQWKQTFDAQKKLTRKLFTPCLVMKKGQRLTAWSPLRELLLDQRDMSGRGFFVVPFSKFPSVVQLQCFSKWHPPVVCPDHLDCSPATSSAQVKHPRSRPDRSSAVCKLLPTRFRIQEED